ncbi:dual oxidase 2 [Dermatophagoides farinae]|uniref:dual oxidase 2 n=1 Tax=Dermatophagoides farinae TaxID=6954 RepID=UPI003F5DDA81
MDSRVVNYGAIILILMILSNQSSAMVPLFMQRLRKANESKTTHTTIDGDFDDEISGSLLRIFKNFPLGSTGSSNEFISYDGWYHDLNKPDLGSKGSPLKRLMFPKLSQPSVDSNMTSNIFMLSESIFKDNQIHFSVNGKNLMSVYFGMFIMNEMMYTWRPRCPPNYRKIPLPKTYLDRLGNEVRYRPSTPGHSFMFLNEIEHCKLSESSTEYLPSKMNFRSIWIDGELVYGDSKFCADFLRTYKRGRLIDHTKHHQSSSNHRFGRECFNYFGDNPINENPFLLTIHFIWIHWHNLIAELIYQKNPNLSDQAIYDEARKYTIATIQHIVFNEWLPSFIGETLPPYHGYDPMIDPQISDLFEILSNVYHYTLISPFVFKLGTECSKNFRYSILRTCNTYFEPLNYVVRGGFEKILVGLLLQSAQRDDHYIVEDILMYSKGTAADFTRQNLIAILLQYSRDFGTPDYLSIRKQIGLDQNITYGSFKQLSRTQWSYPRRLNHQLERKLSQLYRNNVANIDLIVGALLENNGKEPGPLIKYFFIEQFLRLRNGDRLYFENTNNGLFDSYQIRMLKQIKFSDIIRSITKFTDELIQPAAFKLPTMENDDENSISDKCFESLRKLIRVYPCDTTAATETKCLTLATFQTIESMENCTNGQCYDYFNGSELSFIATILFIPLFIMLLIIILKLLVHRRNRQTECQRIKVSKLRRMTINDDSTLVQEWLGNNSDGYRNTIVILNSKIHAIVVKLQYENRIVRSIYLKKSAGKISVELSANRCQNHMLIRFPKEYDLVLKFDSYYEREKFLTKFETFLNEIHYQMERSSKELRFIFRSAYTKCKRQKHLEKFFRVVFTQAFNRKPDKIGNLDLKSAKEIIETELTQFEFAEVLSMRPDATFVQQMFRLIDKDNNGYISFREFLDVIIIFAKGSAEQKIRIMFDMYDMNQTGRLSIDDFRAMIKSLLEIANQSVSSIEMNETIQSMLLENGFTAKKELTFEDFSRLFHNYKEELGYTELNFDLSSLDKLPQQMMKSNKRQSKIIRANDTIVRSYFGGHANNGPDFTRINRVPTFLKIETQENSREPDWIVSWIRFFDAKKKEIFCLIFYNLIAMIIFLDKAYYYANLNESSGLRQIAGMGIPITRGSASVMMFTYSTILLTMCRNIITVIRETFLHHYIPFDSVVAFHKYIAFLAFIMAILHSFGHVSNFYHISTQRPSDLNCILSETYFTSNEMPKFHHWVFGTLTGLTGFSLLCLLFIIYIFAIPYSRRHIFNAFWITHSLYPLFYLLMVLHGLGRLVQPPIFYFYFVIPLTLFTIDRLISASRKKIEISVVKATLHPSNVTHLEFKKPPNFDYKSGQWLRIACLGLNPGEYHPFTIASAPHESTLSLYIRAIGPFTKNIRQMYDHNLLNGRPYPKLYLDGPYGEGHQDWFRFDVSVLVGGGIGITPFASIIKDITFRSSINAKINCKKVYFLWVTRTQKHFEWMSDVIREAEEKDFNNLLVTHIFITQFYEKFDLRTTMLYICERHFQRISNKSLFTGLQAKTHFGRPNFKVFLESLQYEHRNVERVGVFSCGPNPMTNSVQQACDQLNRKEGIIFKHHFENF